jgi:organic hydroperoxide reductase OsmC/OhrA
MEEIAPGRMAVTKVWLRPEIRYEGKAPSAAEAEHLHHLAHAECFIANSVKTEVVVEERAAA